MLRVDTVEHITQMNHYSVCNFWLKDKYFVLRGRKEQKKSGINLKLGTYLQYLVIITAMSNIIIMFCWLFSNKGGFKRCTILFVVHNL